MCRKPCLQAGNEFNRPPIARLKGPRMNFRLLPILLLLAAGHQQQAAQPPAASQAPKQPAPAASATDDASAEAKPLSDAQIRQQAAEKVLQYAKLRHCGNADLVKIDEEGRDETDTINSADAAIVLSTRKHNNVQNTVVAVLYHSDSIAAQAMLPRTSSGPDYWGVVMCGGGSISAYYLQLAGYNIYRGKGNVVVSDTNLFEQIYEANVAAAREHATDPKGNPYFINARFIESVKKQGENLEIVSLQNAGDLLSPPFARWKYTVHLFDLKITSSEYLGEVHNDE